MPNAPVQAAGRRPLQPVVRRLTLLALRRRTANDRTACHHACARALAPLVNRRVMPIATTIARARAVSLPVADRVLAHRKQLPPRIQEQMHPDWHPQVIVPPHEEPREERPAERGDAGDAKHFKCSSTQSGAHVGQAKEDPGDQHCGHELPARSSVQLAKQVAAEQDFFGDGRDHNLREHR